MQKSFQSTTEQYTQLIQNRDTHISSLLDKMLGLISTKDPMAFQAVQAMNFDDLTSTRIADPSDEGEVQKLIDEGRLDELDNDIINAIRSIPGSVGFG